MNKGISNIVGVIIVAVILMGGIGGYMYLKNKQIEPVVCTMDAKQCPDGSAVGRIGPNCEFAECPIVASTSTPTSTINISCLDYWNFFINPKNYDDGQPHEEIKVIQEKLGITSMNGNYGFLTKAAIKTFNKKFDIHQQIDCCDPAIDYKSIHQGTISKFNELYCNKPLYQITITRKNNPEVCKGTSPCVIEVHSLNDPNPKYKASFSEVDKSISIKVPYSSGVQIRPLNDDNQCISKIYNNDNLIAYYEKGDYKNMDEIINHTKILDDLNFMFTFNVYLGIHELVIKNVKSNYNILIETEGCFTYDG